MGWLRSLTHVGCAEVSKEARNKNKKKKARRSLTARVAGDGTSCSCTGGYLDFSSADANAGVLCYVDGQLSGQIDSAVAALQVLQLQLAVSSCNVSAQLNFGAWLAAFNAFCSGPSCPALPDPNLFAFLQANTGFNRGLQQQLAQG